jgi:hypothetical protein
VGELVVWRRAIYPHLKRLGQPPNQALHLTGTAILFSREILVLHRQVSLVG